MPKQVGTVKITFDRSAPLDAPAYQLSDSLAVTAFCRPTGEVVAGLYYVTHRPSGYELCGNSPFARFTVAKEYHNRIIATVDPAELAETRPSRETLARIWRIYRDLRAERNYKL